MLAEERIIPIGGIIRNLSKNAALSPCGMLLSGRNEKSGEIKEKSGEISWKELVDLSLK